jgi:hypothetical protein
VPARIGVLRVSRAAWASVGESWQPVNVAAILAGDLTPLEPTVFARQDGLRLLYPRRVNSLIGEPESCKSFAAQIAAGEVLKDGGTVWYLDFESEARDVVGHLLALGVSEDDIVKGLVYVRPDEPIGDAVDFLHSQRDSHLTVVDGFNSAMVANDLEPNSNRDVEVFKAKLIRPLQQITAGPLVTVDHVVKDSKTRGDWAVGAGQKKALVDGAMLAFELIQPFGRGRTGVIKILVFKDRPGALRGQAIGKEIARLQLTANAEGDHITYTLDAPAGDQVGASGFRPTVLMERISRFLEDISDPLSGYAILGAVPGKREGKLIALKVLTAEGCVSCQPGPRGGLLYKSQKAFREGSSAPVPDRFPTGSQEPIQSDRFPVPPPHRGEPVGTGQSVGSTISTGSPSVGSLNGGGSRCPLGRQCSQPPNGRVVCCGQPVLAGVVD